jgi:hypothetical protein
MVGKSSRFSVVRSDKDRISATDEQTEIFGVEANGDVKVANSLYAKGVLQSDYQVKAQSIELSSSTPYIDFHHNNSTDDYTHRLLLRMVPLQLCPVCVSEVGWAYMVLAQVTEDPIRMG